jgi:hypothetical protein
MNTYTVFGVNSAGGAVGGRGRRVHRNELLRLIDELLDSADGDDDDDSKAITHVEIHDGSCSLEP